MSNGFNPLSLFKPTGNPVVQKLLQNRQTNINQLLDQESFPTEFRRDTHQLLEKYMTYKKYETLVEYITVIGNEKQKNRGYKYPFIAAQILSIENQHTFKYFISKKSIIEQEIVIEEIQVQQQIDSDRSFMSSKSEGSIISDESQAEKQSSGSKDIEDVENMPQVQMQKTPSEINEDDFPFIQQTKKVKIKQKRQRVINHEYKPLLNKLYDYFSNPFNHTLTGYVCKVLNAMLTKNPSIYPELLLKTQTTLFLSHIQSRSTQQLLVRVLTYESEDDNDITFQYNLLMICLHKVLDHRSGLVVQNLSFIISEILNKISDGDIKSTHFKKLIKQILRVNFLSKLSQYFYQTVKQLEQSINQHQNDQIQITQLRIKQFSKIFSTFLDLYLKVKSKQDFKEDVPSMMHEYEDHINKFTESAYKKLQFQAIQEQDKIFKNKYGLTKVLLINILFTLIKQNLGFCQQILAQKQCFFQILLQLVKKSPLNSILHNSIFSIFSYFVQGLKKDNQKIIIGSLFRQAFDMDSKYAFLHFSYETFKLNQNLNPVKKIGYTGHLVNLCTEIYNTKCQGNQVLQKLQKTSEWSYIIERQIQPQLLVLKKTLGSYTKLKNKKAPIQFDRQVILQMHKQFLKGTKFTTLDEFQNFDEEQSDTQEQRRHHSGHAIVSKQTQKQIQQMQMQEFQINAGLKTNLQYRKGQQTKDSITGIQ